MKILKLLLISFLLVGNIYADVNDSYTVSLLHLNTDYADSAVGGTHTWTPAGTATISGVSPKFGAGSLLLDGNSDYISSPNSTDWDFGTGDWTVDFWVKRNGDQTNYNGLVSLSRATAAAGLTITFNAGGAQINRVGVYSDSDGSWGLDLIETNAVDNLTWTHIAVVRNGNTLTIYKGGIDDGNLDVTGHSFNSIGTGCNIGRCHTDTNNYYLNGEVDELRISKGIARWTTNFTPPTSEYSSTKELNSCTINNATIN